MLPPTGIKPGGQVIIPLQKKWNLPDTSLLTSSLQTYAAAGEDFELQMSPLENNKRVLNFPIILSGEKHPKAAFLNPDIVDEHGVPEPNVQRLKISLPDNVASSGTADALVITNTGKVPALLYSIGLPRPHSFQQISSAPDLFALPSPMPIETFSTPVPGGQWINNWKYAEKKSNHLRILLPTPHPAGWIYIPEPYFSGWNCRVDGKTTEIAPCETMFRAVQIPANAREVLMTYWPPRFTEGLLLALVGVLLSGSTIIPAAQKYFLQKCMKQTLNRTRQ
jgi:hypothetical protein